MAKTASTCCLKHVFRFVKFSRGFTLKRQGIISLDRKPPPNHVSQHFISQTPSSLSSIGHEDAQDVEKMSCGKPLPDFSKVKSDGCAGRMGLKENVSCGLWNTSGYPRMGVSFCAPEPHHFRISELLGICQGHVLQGLSSGLLSEEMEASSVKRKRKKKMNKHKHKKLRRRGAKKKWGVSLIIFALQLGMRNFIFFLFKTVFLLSHCALTVLSCFLCGELHKKFSRPCTNLNDRECRCSSVIWILQLGFHSWYKLTGLGSSLTSFWFLLGFVWIAQFQEESITLQIISECSFIDSHKQSTD